MSFAMAYMRRNGRVLAKYPFDLNRGQQYAFFEYESPCIFDSDLSYMIVDAHVGMAVAHI